MKKKDVSDFKLILLDLDGTIYIYREYCIRIDFGKQKED